MDLLLNSGPLGCLFLNLLKFWNKLFWEDEKACRLKPNSQNNLLSLQIMIFMPFALTAIFFVCSICVFIFLSRLGNFRGKNRIFLICIQFCWRFCKQGTLQFCIIKPLTSFLVIILQVQYSTLRIFLTVFCSKHMIDLLQIKIFLWIFLRFLF